MRVGVEVLGSRVGKNTNIHPLWPQDLMLVIQATILGLREDKGGICLSRMGMCSCSYLGLVGGFSG